MTTTSSELYRVTVWDKKADNPYYILEYGDEDTAKFVARNMKRHYVDEWAHHGETIYEVRLQRIMEESDA